MKKVLVLGLIAGWSGVVFADIYKCTDDSGHVTYSNVSAKNCTRLIAGGDEKPPAAKAAPKSSAAATASPAGFPKVTSTTQKARDDDRRRILDGELGAEQKSLDEAKKSLAEQEAAVQAEERSAARPGAAKPAGNPARTEERLKPFRDSVAMHERNIEALKKEISNLR